MKKIILALALLGVLQVSTAQTKKKTASKAKTSVTTTKSKTAAKSTATSSKAAPSKTTTKIVSSRKAGSTSHFSKSDFQLNAGIGASGWGIPVYVGADYGVADDISVGAEVSYRSFKEDYFFANYNSTIIGIGGNGNYHFGRLLKTPKEWDLYAGLNLSYYIWSYDNDIVYLGNNSSGIALGGQVGARYFFNKNFAVNAELGGASATSGAKIGITYKL